MSYEFSSAYPPASQQKTSPCLRVSVLIPYYRCPAYSKIEAIVTPLPFYLDSNYYRAFTYPIHSAEALGVEIVYNATNVGRISRLIWMTDSNYGDYSKR